MNLLLRFTVLMVGASLSATDALAQQPRTFNRDVAPVLFARCAACHRPWQTAPFSLLSFEDVRPRAKRIAEVVRTRAMPPWKPEPNHGAFQGDRRLTQAEIETIETWVADGMLRGSPSDLPPLPAV